MKNRNLKNRRGARTIKAELKKAIVQHANHRPVMLENTAAEPYAIPYDENLLERARTQWQFGDWDSLSKLGRNTLQHHPDRAKLALLVAAGHMQQGDTQSARQFTQFAQDWGCSKKLVGQVLIAGVYNSLGRASAVIGEELRALKHFETAIAIGTPGSEMRLITQARVGQQLAQLGLPVSDTLQKSLAVLDYSPTQKNRYAIRSHHRAFAVHQLANHGLGDAWAGSTVNTAIFRHHGILTSGQFQFTAFYVNENSLRLLQRDLSNESPDTISTFDLPGQYNLRDTHSSISLGCDREGYLHLSYGHHGIQLRYRRSSAPLNIQGWTEELGMTGVHESKVTYPSFILPSNNRSLMLLYRDGVWGKGAAHIKTYDEASQSWSDRPIPILSGADQSPWTSNAYWNHPAIGTDGSLHLSFVWRTHSIGAEERVNNINICYARSPDNGITWTTSRNRPYQLPITQVNAETAHPVSPGSNLINQTSMALDSHNRPHIVFYSDDPDGIPQYQHLWFDGTIWKHHYISQRKIAFVLKDGDTLQIPISRPEIVIDRQDNIYVIYRGDLTDNRMAVVNLSAPDYSYDPEQIRIVWDAELGCAEPIIDRTRWQNENVLTLMVQNNQQPAHDLQHELLNTPVSLIDLRFC